MPNKIDTMRNHSNTDVRIMTKMIENAYEALRNGDLYSAAACVRLAYAYEQEIQTHECEPH